MKSIPKLNIEVVETFHIYPKNDVWIDFVCVWKRVETPETEITIPKPGKIGALFHLLIENQFDCKTELKYNYVINNQLFYGYDF